MSPETIFRIHLVLGYVAWTLCFSVYILPRLRSMPRFQAHRAIATLHSFRFFGLVFILPGVVGHLPSGFATYTAYGDFATGILALLALLTARSRPLFWSFVVAFNLVGASDIAPRLLPRHPGRSPFHRRGVRLCLRHPHPLRADPDDHALLRHLLAGAPSPQQNRLEAFHEICSSWRITISPAARAAFITPPPQYPLWMHPSRRSRPTLQVHVLNSTQDRARSTGGRGRIFDLRHNNSPHGQPSAANPPRRSDSFRAQAESTPIQARVRFCQLLESFEITFPLKPRNNLFPCGMIGCLRVVGDARSVQTLVNARGNPARHSTHPLDRIFQQVRKRVLVARFHFEHVDLRDHLFVSMNLRHDSSPSSETLRVFQPSG